MTPVIDGPVRPPFTSTKSVVPTPVTDSLNVTVQALTLKALVGLEPARSIETTLGAIASLTVVVTVFEVTVPLRCGEFGFGFGQFPEQEAVAEFE